MDSRKYLYITIERMDNLVHKRPVFVVTTNKTRDVLGQIFYLPRWRQYGFEPISGSIFSRGCLQDISAFMDTIRKAKGS